MIVNRRTFVVKRGHMDQLLVLIREAEQQSNSSAHAFRAYIPETGFLDSVAFEWEYESLEEYERDWAEWAATPEGVAVQETLYDVTETGGTNEVWRWVE